MPVISAANLSIGYKGSPIVSNINLRLSTGRIICLLGANGAGKTTLINLLLRFYDVSGSGMKLTLKPGWEYSGFAKIKDVRYKEVR